MLYQYSIAFRVQVQSNTNQTLICSRYPTTYHSLGISLIGYLDMDVSYCESVL